MLSLQERAILSLEESSVNVSHLKGGSLEDIHDRITRVRNYFHVKGFNTRPLCRLFKSKIEKTLSSPLPDTPTKVTVEEDRIDYFWDFKEPMLSKSTNFTRSDNDNGRYVTELWFTVRSGKQLVLVHSRFIDWDFDQSEDNEINVSVLFNVPKRLDALLMDSFVKRPPKVK